MSYSDELPAKVLALVDGEGYSIRGAAREVGVDVHTAWDWIQAANRTQLGNKPILDRWTRRVIKAQDLMDRGLDFIAEGDDERAYKSLQTLNIIAGTGTDKLQKDKEQSSPTRDLAQLVIVINAAKEPEQESFIEGEVKDA